MLLDRLIRLMARRFGHFSPGDECSSMVPARALMGSHSMRSQQFGKTGLVFTSNLTGLYCTPKMSTREQSIRARVHAKVLSRSLSLSLFLSLSLVLSLSLSHPLSLSLSLSLSLARCLTRVDCQSTVDPSSLPGLPSRSVRVKLGSSFDTFRRRWTIYLYWKSRFQTNNGEPRLSGTELRVDG